MCAFLLRHLPIPNCVLVRHDYKFINYLCSRATREFILAKLTDSAGGVLDTAFVSGFTRIKAEVFQKKSTFTGFRRRYVYVIPYSRLTGPVCVQMHFTFIK